MPAGYSSASPRSDYDIGLPTLLLPKLDERIKPNLAAGARRLYIYRG
jgi:hypothetical protein